MPAACTPVVHVPACQRAVPESTERVPSLLVVWPRLMRAEQAAAYVGEKSVRAFRRSVGKLYPEPVKVPGKGDRWLKEHLDSAIDQLARHARVADIADQL